MNLNYLQSIVLGALQGITELFPISSLGHSVLLPSWLGGSWKDLTQNGSTYLPFIVSLHVATALALIIFYWRDWFNVLGGAKDVVTGSGFKTERSQLFLKLVAGTIIVGLVGLLLQKKIEKIFSDPVWVAGFLVINGAILLLIEYLIRSNRIKAKTGSVEHIGLKTATIMGASQVFALLPGISRSGICISTGLFRKISHEASAHFAFLLATPVILAAGLLKIPKLFSSETTMSAGPIIVGALTAFVAAFLSVKFLAKYFHNKNLIPFAIYCFVVGIASIIKFGFM